MNRCFLIALAFAAITLPTVVDASDVPLGDPASDQHSTHATASTSTLVEKVRNATDAFRQAIPGDYAQFLGCVSGPDAGAMGVHFVNFGLVDGQPDAAHPEALIY